MKRLRVLFAPRNIAGQPTEWAAALKELGHHAEVWSFGEAAFGIPVDRVFDQDRLLADPLYRWQVLDDAVRGFDVFHFQYGRSLLNAHEPELPELWDLPLLRSLGKRVFMHWHGSDVRLKSKHMEREGPDSYLADATVDEDAILARVSICRRFCDRMFVSTPGLLDYVPDARHIPLAIDAAAWATERGPEPDKPVVVHIPSKRATKGSHHVDAALIPLHEQGVIEYRALSGLTREQVKAEFRRADMVVDSMTIGDHGLVAVEAMACGAVALAHVHERNRAAPRARPWSRSPRTRSARWCASWRPTRGSGPVCAPRASPGSAGITTGRPWRACWSRSTLRPGPRSPQGIRTGPARPATRGCARWRPRSSGCVGRAAPRPGPRCATASKPTPPCTWRPAGWPRGSAASSARLALWGDGR